VRGFALANGEARVALDLRAERGFAIAETLEPRAPSSAMRASNPRPRFSQRSTRLTSSTPKPDPHDSKARLARQCWLPF